MRALRARGAEIHCFSIRPGTALTDADREEARATFTLFSASWARYVVAHLRALARSPFAYLRTLGHALRSPSGDSQTLLTKLGYFGGAVLVWDECRRRHLRHIHAHFTRPAADVAQLVADLGSGASQDRCTWSFTAHGTDIFDDAPLRLAGKVRRASAVICVSDFGRSRLMGLVDDQHWEKLKLVRCGLDASWLAIRPPIAHTDSGDPPLRLLAVGRAEREKGHAILVEAVAELGRRGVPVRLELIGDGSKLGALRRKAAQLGLDGQVAFVGQVGQDSIREHYAAAGVFCLPSFGEGVPVVLMEAMASGLPVVATGIMGVPELVVNEVTGLLVPPGRPAELADALQRLAHDEPLRARLAEAGQRKVAADFNLEASARRLEQIFVHVTGVIFGGPDNAALNRSGPSSPRSVSGALQR